MKRLLATSTAVAVLGATLMAGSAPAEPTTTAGAKPEVTGKGVGKVKVGATYRALRKKNLVGKIGPGCELGGPNTRSAKLKAPLKGFVNFTQTKARKVTDITISGGASARGVEVGDTTADIKAAYPSAVEDHQTDEVFGVTLVRIPKSDGGKFQFAVSTSSEKIVNIGVPGIGFCE